MRTRTKKTAHVEIERRVDHYVFREPRSANELRSFLQKRYSLFQQSSLSAVVSENVTRVDMDSYDLTSFHLGLIAAYDDGTEDLVGYIRLITETMTPQTMWVIRLASESEELWEEVDAPKKAPLSSLNYFPDALDVYERFSQGAGAFAEPSRFCIDHSARTYENCRFVIMGVAALWYALGIPHAVLSCAPEHARLYAPLGFAQTPGTSVQFLAEAGIEAACMLLTRDQMTPDEREAVANLASHLAEHDELQFFPGEAPGRSRASRQVAVRESSQMSNVLQPVVS